MHGEKAIASDLIEYGYESNKAWLKELKGVTPDYSESHWPEYFTTEELKQRMRGKYSRAFAAFLRSLGS